MADSDAERSRRSYWHRKGDHSLCRDPERCTAADAGRLQAVGDQPPARGPRAQQLWDEMTEQLVLGPSERLLLEEACACVDRLDLLRGATDPGSLAEARHQSNSLKGLMTEVRRGADANDPMRRGRRRGVPASPPASPRGQNPDWLRELREDDFSTRLAARRAKTLTDQHDPGHPPNPQGEVS